jgi:thermitase
VLQGRSGRGIALAAVLAASLATPAPAEAGGGDVIVRFRADAQPAERAAARSAADTKLERALPLTGLQLVDPEPGVSVEEAVAQLERSGDVLYAEPDAVRVATLRPNDRRFGSQWGMQRANLPGAWDHTTGSLGVGIGVLDSGIDFAHPDLLPNMWRNPGESGDGREYNGLDDDGNGLADDWRGWDWVDGDNSPGDANGHGTHVAGILGARGNDNRGVAGASWRAGLVSLRVLNADGAGRISDSIAAYNYAARTQLPIVNASLAGTDFSQAEYDAIRAASGTLVIAAAGNEGKDNDRAGSYPCNQPLPNVICVGATDQDDVLTGFSNFGHRAVDLAAPGDGIISTQPDGSWGYMSGTSMATPHVAGTAALIRAMYPDASVAAVRAALLASVDLRPGLSGKTLTGGRLNAGRALASPPSESAFPADEGIDPARDHGAAPPPRAAPQDRRPPAVSARLVSKLSLRQALRRGLRVRARCSEACTLLLDLTVKRASIASIEIAPRDVVVGKGRGGIRRAGAKVIRLRMTRRARRLLRRGRRHALTLRARATDPAGNRATLRRSLRLRG